MAKKLTEKQWNAKFVSEFSKEIESFCKSNKVIFSEEISKALRDGITYIYKTQYRFQLSISKLEDCENRDELMLADYNGVKLFAAEYYKGELSIGVIDRRKVVFGHVITFDKKTVRYDEQKLLKAIKLYFSLFLYTLNTRKTITDLTTVAGNRNI
jgi:hypothetical protein